MNQEWIERYLYEVTKQMPRKKREDVSRELRGLIEDMLAERCGAVTPGEKDVRIVLMELGSPRELREKYDEREKQSLIGPPYYGIYRFVLKIVLSCVLFGLTVAAGITQILEPQSWYLALGNWLAMLWNGCLGGFAITTLLFAFFSHRGVKLEQPFQLEDLPPVPRKDQEISRGSCIFGIGFSVVFGVLFLAAPQIFQIFDGINGVWIPVFDVEAIREVWYIIVLFGAAGIVGELVKLVERQHNRTVTIVTCVTDVISGALAIWWLTGHTLLNPAFTGFLTALFREEGAFIGEMFANFQYFLLGVILFALVLDAVTDVWKYLGGSRKDG